MITKDRRTDNISQIIPFTAIGLAQALGYELGTHQEIDWEEEVESLKHVHMPRYFWQSTTVKPAYCWCFIPSGNRLRRRSRIAKTCAHAQIFLPIDDSRTGLLLGFYTFGKNLLSYDGFF